MTATRIGHEQVAGLPAAILREGAHRRLELVGLERDRAGGAVDRRARRAQGVERRRPVPALRHEQGRVDLDAIDPQEPDELADRAELRQALLDDRDERPKLLGAGQPVDPAGPQLLVEERQEPLDEVVGLEAADPLAVHPFEPLAVEDRAALLDVLEVEPPGQVVEREDLLFRAGRPAQQRQEVDHRLGDEALAAVVGDRGLALALAHLRPVGVEDERQVAERRDVVAERPEQQDVLRGVRDVVLAADDVADRHVRVVDDDREVVERRAVAPDDQEVAADVRGVELDLAPNEVVPADDPRRDAEAGGGSAALGLARGAFLGREIRAATDVVRRLMGRFLRLPVRVEVLGRAVARVGEILREQRRGSLGVALDALQLAVRRIRTRDPRRRRYRGLRPR